MSTLTIPNELAVTHGPHKREKPHRVIPKLAKERILRKAVERMNRYANNEKMFCVCKYDFKEKRSSYQPVRGHEVYELRNGKIVEVLPPLPEHNIFEETTIEVMAFWIFHGRHNYLVIDAEKVYRMPETYITCGNCYTEFLPKNETVSCPECGWCHCMNCGHVHDNWGDFSCPECE